MSPRCEPSGESRQVTTVELEFLCDLCGGPVQGGEGSLYVRYAAIRGYETARREWQQARQADGLVDVPSLLMQPGPAPWLIHHDDCALGEVDGYSIDVAQVRTWRALLSWTAQLMGKSWLPATNWQHVIGAAADGRDERITEKSRSDAA